MSKVINNDIERKKILINILNSKTEDEYGYFIDIESIMKNLRDWYGYKFLSELLTHTQKEVVDRLDWDKQVN